MIVLIVNVALTVYDPPGVELGTVIFNRVELTPLGRSLRLETAMPL